MSNLNAARRRRLAQGDAAISRCHLCGAWTWRGTCTTNDSAHTTHQKESA